MAWLLTFLSTVTMLLLCLCLAYRWPPLSNLAVANEMKKDSRENITPPARDPKLAVEEEYQLALQRGTVQALQLFITRHPDDPLAEKARNDLQRLLR
jgi:hypothetical protein